MLQRFASSEAPNHIAQALLRGNLDVATLRAMSPLEENAQKLVDKAVVNVGLNRLTLVADLIAGGLTFPVTDPLSVMEVQWEKISKTGGAIRSMAPNARGERQMPARSIARVPLYITSDDFSVGIRTLKMSQRIGTPIDTTLVEQATRRVNESLEDAFINGGITADGYTAYGLLNAPNANTYAYGSGEAWDAAAGGHTGDEILVDVLAMIDKLQADNKFGPYTLYVPTLYGNTLQRDFKANGDLTIRQRLEQIDAGGRTLQIRVADMLGANRTALVQMTSDVLEVVDGQRPVVVPWTSADGFTLHWMVMAIIVPRFRDDYDGNSGICLGYTS